MIIYRFRKGVKIDLKKREKLQDINIKNISGVSKQYQRNGIKNLIDRVVQGCAEIDRKEQIEREKQQDYQKNEEFVSEIVKDIKELGKKYEEQDNFESVVAVGENNSVEDVVVDENIPVA